MASTTITLPAPTGGLNLLETPTGKKANEAEILDNYFVEPHRVTLRKGYSSHATGFGSAVHSILPYHGGTGTNALFAAAGTAIYDITSAGAIGAAAVSSLTNAKWQFVQFSAGGGDYLVLVNGADGVRTYDGSTWATQTITGATAANFVDVTSHKSRLWFTSNASPSAYYLASGAISGAASELDLAPVFRLGGVIAFITPVSFNAGAGFDDGLCFVSTEGEVALYIGTDPASANTWALAGVFRIGRPVRQRAYTRLNGDAIVLTGDGVVSLLQAMRLAPGYGGKQEVSTKIDPTLRQQVEEQTSTFGWDMIVYPTGQRLIINAPQSTSIMHQWVMNTQNAAWCRFKNMNALCWGLLAEKLYFGDADTVWRADNTNADDGTAIEAQIKWAFNAYRANGGKQVIAMRPHIVSNGTPSIALGADIDFSDDVPSDVAGSAALNTSGIWDTATWDNGIWGGSTNVVREWSLVGGFGTWVAPRIYTNTANYEISLNAIDVMFSPAKRAIFA